MRNLKKLNKLFFLLLLISCSESEIVKNEPIEKNVDIVIEKDSFNILHINPENTDDLKDKIINKIIYHGKSC